jgi:branched-chain amino acid transport system permease protein
VFASTTINRRRVIIAIVLLVIGFGFHFANDGLTEALLGMSTTARFFLAIGVAVLLGVILGALVEVTLIRPLYQRPIYQLMLTLGLSFIIIEVVRAIWGRPEFTMPKAALFDGGGDGCPARSLGDLIQHQCSTVIVFDSRIRTYNEIFIILVGIVVLVGVWLVLQRTRIGMIIRAGVQDSEMVEALGINVRQVFTLVFALGVGLASLGGVLAAPSVGLSTDMGARFLLLALIALAIGGLTSFPGAAAGSILVGLLQQFMIKYGQIGINLPFLDEPFKPSPPLVPASVVLLMVIILLILPNGLFGRSDT